MIKGWGAMAALAMGAVALSGCADGVVGKGDAPVMGWVDEANPGLELAFAEPTGLGFGTTDSDVIREPASSADLAIRPDFEPMLDAVPLAQEPTEVADVTDEDGREVATSYFDDSLMTDDGVLPPPSKEEPPLEEADTADLP